MTNEPDDFEQNELLSALLSNPAALLAMGVRILPKGCMALVLSQELGHPLEEVEPLAQKLDDAIFKAGYIYVQEDQIRLADDA